MKNLFFLMAFACLCAKGFSQNTQLRDGLYLVTEVVTDSTKQKPVKDNVFVSFHPLFLENAPDSAQGLLVSTSQLVPLELSKDPALQDQPDHKKRIQLSFTRLAADKLATFTSDHLGKQVTLVVGGQALTVHKVRAAITGGKLEISRCDDNACQKIYVELKRNVK